MILVIGGIKGSSGKTTIATNLSLMRASMGYKVLLVDADEQHTASDFAEHRAEQGLELPFTTVRLSGKSVRTEAKKLYDSFDSVIIDTGGRDTTSQRAALSIAHCLLVPFLPRSFDIWTINQVSALVEEIQAFNEKLKACIFINRADPSGQDTKDTAEILRESQSLKYLDTPIIQRKAFSNAAAEGLAVFELKPSDNKAFSEICSLYMAVFQQQFNAKIAA